VTYAQAERHLLALERFGMRFELDRMRRLLTALGSPQERFASIHVVGTNGKSSTVRMIAAILARHGRHVGAYLSPHLVSFVERVRIADADLDRQRFAAAVERVARAATKVQRALAEGDHVTQFEALTAVAFDEMARDGVDVAVVEAGLGGRYDATNVLSSGVQVLTSVGLEHTRWLGSTIADIAAEKLDVVRPGATLVVGEDLHPDALALARTTCDERGASLVVVGAGDATRAPGLAPYQQRNFALARAAAAAHLGELDEEAVSAAAIGTIVPGRFEVVDHEPVTIVDAAHNPDGIAALAEALRHFLHGRRLVACVSILDDKDAAEMLRELVGLCSAVVCTASANPRVLPAATLASIMRQIGGPPTQVVAEPREALAAARKAAGPGGVALATGSIYLLADLLATDDAHARSTR